MEGALSGRVTTEPQPDFPPSNVCKNPSQESPGARHSNCNPRQHENKVLKKHGLHAVVREKGEGTEQVFALLKCEDRGEPLR